MGKSGPLNPDFAMNSSKLASSDSDGSFIKVITPSITSLRLWGGMFVAIPTAIPDAPLIKRLGSLVGSTVGSRSDPS